MAYLAPRGRCWSAGSSSNEGRCDHDHHRDLLPSDGGRSSESWTTRSRDRGHSFTLGVIGRLRGHVEELHDRSPIEARSWSICCGINPTIVGQVFVRICSQIDAKSTHDQTTIVVDRGRCRRKAWPGNAKIVAKLRPTHGRSRSCDIAPRNRSHDPCKLPPRPLQWPRLSGLISFFRSMYFPLLFFNF